MENGLLHLKIQELLKTLSIPRKEYSSFNKWIVEKLNRFVEENDFEGNCCYFVKNIDNNSNVCFVHKFDGKARSFQNLELSSLPENVSKDDVLVYLDGKIVVQEEVTSELLEEKLRRLVELKESFSLFTEDGKEYVVCDKSDDIIRPQMSLRMEDGKEYSKIDISSRLYEKIKVGDKVVYRNGDWEVV